MTTTTTDRAPVLLRHAKPYPPLATESNLALLFRNRSALYADRVRWRQKQGDTWRVATGRQNLALVNELIAGLYALGARRGDAVAILSGTRWEWTAADWAILGLGGICVTLYPSNTAATVEFMLNDSGARYVFAEDATQYAKLLEIRDRIPQARRVILFDDVPLVEGDEWALAFETLRQVCGRSPEEADALAAELAAAIQPEDPASIVYTSGTTGRPKGAVHTHRSLLAQVVGAATVFPSLRPGMVDLLFLPLAHTLGREEHLLGVDRGLETVIASSLKHLAKDIREARPDLILSVPRVYEKAYSTIQATAAHGLARREIFGWAKGIARQASHYFERRQALPLWLRLRYRVADALVFRRIRAGLGGRLQFAVTGGAPLDPSILEFFVGAGVLLLEGWGLTETGGALTVNQVDDYRLGTVGRVFPGNEIRIAPDGEILARGACLFSGYHNAAAETAAAMEDDGWFRTGDIGTLDAEGFLRIVDRKKDLLVTSGGKKVAPQQVENLLKRIRGVSQAVAYGDRKPYVVALLTLDPEAVRAWAASNGIASRDIDDLAANPRFRAYLDENVARVNAQLARFEQVKRYAILPGDFTVENDLLTPTLKIRRRKVYERYGDAFERLYAKAP